MTTITLHGFEWRESYGSLTLALPLASIETNREIGRQSDTSPRAWLISINGQQVVWQESVQPPYSAEEATLRALVVVKARARKLAKALAL